MTVFSSSKEMLNEEITHCAGPPSAKEGRGRFRDDSHQVSENNGHG